VNSPLRRPGGEARLADAILAHGRKLAREVDAMPYSRALFNRVRDSSPRGSFRRAARFWYLNRVSFGGRRRRPTFGVNVSRRSRVLPARILANLDATIERLRGVSFESVDVARLLDLYDRPTTLFVVDPPYVDLAQPYAVRFLEADHARLADALARVKGTWLLTYNDCPAIRRLYRGSSIRPLAARYTIGCNSASGGSADARELLISNRPFPRAPRRRRSRLGTKAAAK